MRRPGPRGRAVNLPWPARRTSLATALIEAHGMLPRQVMVSCRSSSDGGYATALNQSFGWCLNKKRTAVHACLKSAGSHGSQAVCLM